MLYPFLAKVRYCDYDDMETKESVVIFEAANAHEAMERLDNYYGDTAIEETLITAFCDHLLTFPVEMYDKLKEVMEEYC